VEQDHAADEGDRVSVEHTLAFEDEDYPEGTPNPLDMWYADLEELPIEPEEENNEDQ
jgi:hypothetical protein